MKLDSLNENFLNSQLELNNVSLFEVQVPLILTVNIQFNNVPTRIAKLRFRSESIKA